MLKRILCRDPQKRISIDEVFEHTWMKKESFSPETGIITIRRDLLSTDEINDALVKRYRVGEERRGDGQNTTLTTPVDDMNSEGEEEPFSGVEAGSEKKRRLMEMVMRQVRSTKCSVL